MALLVRYGYIPAPYCIYEQVAKLLPGCVLTMTEAMIQSRATASPRPYWSLQAVAEAGLAQPFAGTADEAADQLQALLLESVRQQMVADVPLGAFLSGGIDSSLVAGLMQAQSPRPVKTFSIGFYQNGFDEAPYAKAVAQHLGTDHTEFYVRPGELRQVISRLPGIYDEPMADSSQIPTVLLCALARQQVTVSLSGDAGDELFGGYASYRKAQRLWPVLALMPRWLRNGAARALKPAAGWGLRAGLGPRAVQGLLERAVNFSEVLPMPSERALHQLLMSPNREPLNWLRAKEEPLTALDELWAWQRLPRLLPRMMYVDTLSYLPDDILVKVDRAAMAVSLETRIPLLDHRVIEFAWRLPQRLQQRRGCGKWLLRQVLHRYVPPELVERPKKGFAVPLAAWLRGPLRSWAEALLSESRLRREGFLNEKTVGRRWQEHLAEQRDWGQALWHVLMFEAWLEQQRAPAAAQTEEPAVTASERAGQFDLCQR